MAFIASGLNVIATGPAFGSDSTGATKTANKLYMYVTGDAAAVVQADGYFDTTDMNENDIVLASMVAGGTNVLKAYVVSTGTGDKDNNDVAITSLITT